MVNEGRATEEDKTNPDEEGLKNLFREIVRPRESLIRFSGIRTLITENAESQLEALYAHDVAQRRP